MMVMPQNISCGYFDSKIFSGMNVSPVRRIGEYEIELFLDYGKTTIRDDKQYEIKRNHILISRPNQEGHSVLPFSTAFIRFRADGEIAQIMDNLPPYFPVKAHNKILREIDDLILISETSNPLLLNSKFLMILNLIVSETKRPESLVDKNYEIIKKAKRFIESNFEETIKLSDISASVHLSEIYFHNIFTEGTGITPHEYLISCRIKNAKRLLWNSKIPVKEVAERSGFGCQQYLNKIFKKETGFTPGEYRKLSHLRYLS